MALLIKGEIGNDLLDYTPLSPIFLLRLSLASGLLTLPISLLPLLNKREKTLSNYKEEVPLVVNLS